MDDYQNDALRAEKGFSDPRPAAIHLGPSAHRRSQVHENERHHLSRFSRHHISSFSPFEDSPKKGRWVPTKKTYTYRQHHYDDDEVMLGSIRGLHGNHYHCLFDQPVVVFSSSCAYDLDPSSTTIVAPDIQAPNTTAKSSATTTTH
jgi:hypothetical protein